MTSLRMLVLVLLTALTAATAQSPAVAQESVAAGRLWADAGLGWGAGTGATSPLTAGNGLAAVVRVGSMAPGGLRFGVEWLGLFSWKELVVGGNFFPGTPRTELFTRWSASLIAVLDPRPGGPFLKAGIGFGATEDLDPSAADDIPVTTEAGVTLTMGTGFDVRLTETLRLVPKGDLWFQIGSFSHWTVLLTVGLGWRGRS